MIQNSNPRSNTPRIYKKNLGQMQFCNTALDAGPASDTTNLRVQRNTPVTSLELFSSANGK